MEIAEVTATGSLARAGAESSGGRGMPSAVGARLRVSAGRVADTLDDGDVAGLGALDDDALLALMTDAAAARAALDLTLAAGAAEVSRRSARELGYSGLAQKRGHRTAVSLVQNVTGQSRADVGRALRTGEDLRPSTTEPAGWLSALRAALRTGTIGQAQFQVIRGGLGDPPIERYPELDAEFLPSAWAEAIEILLREARGLPVEELRIAARSARDRLDPIGVTLRFEERFAARSFRMWIDPHGQHHARIVFDDEAAAWVQTILHAALRPRRGPRFVDSASSPAPTPDERSNEQLQYDTLLAVLRTGSNADPATAFGDRQPGVRIVVEDTAISSRNGVGHVEDSGAALPLGVIEARLCDAGSVRVTLDEHGRPLDVGREQRLFTRKQRIAIAVRDGGCMWSGCTAPISWSEFHHIDHWSEDHGRTDVDDGVPLCRNCHLRLHNQRWRISRERDPVTGVDTYWLHAPPDPLTGATSPPVRLQSKSPRRFRAA